MIYFYILRNQSSEPQQIRIIKHNHEQTRAKLIILPKLLF